MNHQSAHADNDRRDLRSWQEWELVGRDRRIVLCVETHLEMRPGYPGFDSDQLSLLVDQATELMTASASPIDSIRIVPER